MFDLPDDLIDFDREVVIEENYSSKGRIYP